MNQSTRRAQLALRTVLVLAFFGLLYASLLGADQIQAGTNPSANELRSLRAQPVPSPEELQADPSASPDPAGSPMPVGSPGPDDHHHDDHHDPAASPEPAGSPVSRP